VLVDTLEQAQRLRERTDDSSAVVDTVAQRVELLLVAAVPVKAIRCVWRTYLVRLQWVARTPADGHDPRA